MIADKLFEVGPFIPLSQYWFFQSEMLPCWKETVPAYLLGAPREPAALAADLPMLLGHRQEFQLEESAGASGSYQCEMKKV